MGADRESATPRAIAISRCLGHKTDRGEGGIPSVLNFRPAAVIALGKQQKVAVHSQHFYLAYDTIRGEKNTKKRAKRSKKKKSGRPKKTTRTAIELIELQ